MGIFLFLDGHMELVENAGGEGKNKGSTALFVSYRRAYREEGGCLHFDYGTFNEENTTQSVV